jgi:monoamine oxidase
MHKKIIIIGGGLTGLTLGHLLQKENIPFLILEARDRLGGRIFTKYGNNDGTVEMGATWFGKKHQFLHALLKELNIGYFPQHTSGISLFETFSFAPPQKFEMPHSEEEQSFRISGGSSLLIQKLTEKLNIEHIRLNTVVKSIDLQNEKVEIKTDVGDIYTSEKVISTLPPYLFSKTIKCTPELSPEINSICAQTHTWMGESIKFSLEYKNPFWRNSGYSGAAFSQASICSEMHDHSSEDGTFHALKGFLNPGSAAWAQEERKQALLSQLVKYFGKNAKEYTAYHEYIWSKEKYTFVPYDGFMRAHQNNGHPIFRKWHFNGKLRIAGSETATHFPGYMDGAVCAAREVFEQL